MSIMRLAVMALSEPLGSPGVVTLTDDSSSATRGRSAGFQFSSTGATYKYFNSNPSVISYWVTPQTDMDDYEIYATLTSGDTPTGTLDTWLNLGTSREWTLDTAVVSDSVSCVLTISIRWTGDNVVKDTAAYTLTATGPNSADPPPGGNGEPP